MYICICMWLYVYIDNGPYLECCCCQRSLCSSFLFKSHFKTYYLVIVSQISFQNKNAMLSLSLTWPLHVWECINLELEPTMFLPWHLVFCGSLLSLNPLFITPHTAFVSPLLSHVTNATSYLHLQSQSHRSAAAIIVVERWQCPRKTVRTDGKGKGQWKQQDDSISPPRLLPLKTEVQRVVGNCGVFH